MKNLFIFILTFSSMIALGQTKDKIGICSVNSNFSYSLASGECDTYNFTPTSTTGNFGTFITGYLWKFGDGSTSTATSPSHTYASNGTYTVTLITVGVTSSGDCCTDSISKNVTVNCIVTDCGTITNFTEFNNLCSPNVHLSVSTSQYSLNSGWTVQSYDWTCEANNGTIVTGTGASTVVNLSDYICDCPWDITLDITATNSNGDTCIISYTKYNTSGGSELQCETRTNMDSSLHIYPNPARDNINVSLTDSSIIGKGTRIQINDMNGTVKLNEPLEKSSGNSYNVAGLGAGIYFVQLLQGQKVVETQKLIIE